MSLRCNHGLGRCVERHDAADGEVAGARPARAGGGLADDLVGSRPCAPHDRCLRPRAGRVPADVRTGDRRPGHGEPRTYSPLRTGIDLTAAPSRGQCGLDRLGDRTGQRHHPAALGAGPPVLRLPHGGRPARVEPGRSGPLHPGAPEGRAAARAGSAANEAAVPAGPTPRELDLPATARLLPLVDVRQGGAGSAPR